MPHMDVVQCSTVLLYDQMVCVLLSTLHVV